jgi:hypothetical protein
MVNLRESRTGMVGLAPRSFSLRPAGPAPPAVRPVEQPGLAEQGKRLSIEPAERLEAPYVDASPGLSPPRRMLPGVLARAGSGQLSADGVAPGPHHRAGGIHAIGESCFVRGRYPKGQFESFAGIRNTVRPGVHSARLLRSLGPFSGSVRSGRFRRGGAVGRCCSVGYCVCLGSRRQFPSILERALRKRVQLPPNW